MKKKKKKKWKIDPKTVDFETGKDPGAGGAVLPFKLQDNTGIAGVDTPESSPVKDYIPLDAEGPPLLEFRQAILDGLTEGREGEIEEFRPMSHRMGGLPLLKEEAKAPVKAYDPNCYICRDSDFRDYGLPLCFPCPDCKAHVAADAGECSECDWDTDVEIDRMEKAEQEAKEGCICYQNHPDEFDYNTCPNHGCFEVTMPKDHL